MVKKAKALGLRGALSKGQRPARATAAGKGADIGTAFVKCAYGEGKKVLYRTERNAFFEVELTDFSKRMLSNAKVKYIQTDERLYVVGDEALKFANIFHKETRRPLSRGIISPQEKEALPMVELLIKTVVGPPSYRGEIAYFSVPGDPLDANFNTIYHKTMLQRFLSDLGYTAKSINEAHAVVLSELAHEGFTGIGLSFGAGMANACLCYRSVPVFTFSVTKAGDWIDQQVAMAVNETASRVSAMKENSLDLRRGPGRSKIESALSVYYNHVIEYVIENVRQAFEETEKKPQSDRPITIVLAGGSSLPKGFPERFREILRQRRFPLEVGAVKLAEHPVRAVAKGALVAARADEEKR